MITYLIIKYNFLDYERIFLPACQAFYLKTHKITVILTLEVLNHLTTCHEIQADIPR